MGDVILMTDKTTDIITDVIKREGGSTATNDPTDAGGRTQYGISETAHPKAWEDGKVTEDEARAIYIQKYVIYPGFHTIPPTHAHVMEQLVDFGVLSGQHTAVKHLQRVLGVKDDGVFGPKSLATLIQHNPQTINNKLVIARVLMLGRIVERKHDQAKYINGWLNRAVSFMVY
jgi:lysozyme family protein